MLSPHNKCFSPGKIEKNKRTRDCELTLNWLEKSKTVLICRRCTDPYPAMMLDVDPTLFKCYMSDIGCLSPFRFSPIRSTEKMS